MRSLPIHDYIEIYPSELPWLPEMYIQSAIMYWHSHLVFFAISGDIFVF